MDLHDKIRKIEALIAKTASEGERQAAQHAKQRLQQQINDRAIEYRVSSNSDWEKKLFVAICKKNGYYTYRYHRQKFTTTMVRISRDMMEQLIWPEYRHYSKLLIEMVDEIANDLIDKIYHDEDEEVIISGEIAVVPNEHARGDCPGVVL